MESLYRDIHISVIGYRESALTVWLLDVLLVCSGVESMLRNRAMTRQSKNIF